MYTCIHDNASGVLYWSKQLPKKGLRATPSEVPIPPVSFNILSFFGVSVSGKEKSEKKFGLFTTGDSFFGQL